MDKDTSTVVNSSLFSSEDCAQNLDFCGKFDESDGTAPSSSRLPFNVTNIDDMQTKTINYDPRYAESIYKNKMAKEVKLKSFMYLSFPQLIRVSHITGCANN